MSEFEVIEETPISLSVLKVHLKALNHEKESYRAEKTNAYLEVFAINTEKEVKVLAHNINDLNILRLKERHVVKIVDIMPKDLDSLRLLFSAENLTIKDEDLKKILDVIPQ